MAFNSKYTCRIAMQKNTFKIGFVFSFDSLMLLNKSLFYLNNNILETFGF